MPTRISAVINTLNEEADLANALSSVKPWVDEIVVVDMQSTDRTLEIAREFGAIVHTHERIGYVEPARAFAVSQASGDWILILDADELVPRPLATRLRDLADHGEVDVVVLPMQNWVFGAPLRGGGWGPAQDVHARFFRRGALRLSDRIHAPLVAEPGRRVLDLRHEPDARLVHFNYVDSGDFLRRLDRYTSIEARAEAAVGRHASWIRAAWRSGLEVVNRYIRLGGWRDGWRGVTLASYMAFYRFAIEAKLREHGEGTTLEQVSGAYEAVTKAILAEYSRISGEGSPDRSTSA